MGYYEKELTVLEDISTKGYLRGIDADGNSVLVPLTSIGGGSSYYEYLGKAYLTTDPGTPTVKGYYICAEDGTYTNFGGQEARTLDRFYWNGSSFDHHPYSNYLEVKTIKDGDMLKQVQWTGSVWQTTGVEWPALDSE